ncbi:MAG: transporter substrate-binding domain-containing protein [Lachnospiraceae bacterium]|nr:transporter substrate-binding domain-containing protein [Lachnospiraceae bacterium]
MNTNTKAKRSKILACMLLAALILPVFSTLVLADQNERKTVRVGYYEDHNFQAGAADDLVKTGYSFEYLQRLAIYTDWEYEYVYGDFSELYDALLSGDIDILTGLAYKEERADLMSYPDLAMGNTLYSFLKDQTRTDITTDPKTFSGKTIGTLEGVMETVVEHFLTANGVEATVEVFSDLDARDQALVAGTVDIIIVEGSATAVTTGIEAFMEVGDNDYFVCVAKARRDILKDLNEAQANLFRANPNLKNELYDRWFRNNAQSAALTDSDRAWLAAHPSFKVGYYKTYLPYSDEGESGRVTGIIKDVVPELFKVLDVNNITVSYQGYSSYDVMLEALHSGEVDAVFPVISEYWTAEQNNITPTNPIISTYYNLVYKDEYPDLDGAVIAMRRSNGLVRAYQKLKCPNSQVLDCDTLAECLDAVASGEADATLINGLRTASYLVSKNEYKNLSVSQIPGNVSLGLGVCRNKSTDVEFLNHAISLLDPDFALTQTYAYQEKASVSVREFIRQNWWIVGIPFALVAVVIIIFAFRELLRNRQHLAEEASHNRELEANLKSISELNEALTEAKNAADQANAAKSNFLFSMSHDIRTPMNAIIGFRDLLERYQDDPEKRQDYLRKIEDANNMLLSSINNVLEMARIESGHITVDEQLYTATQFNDALYSIFDALMRQKDITFTRELDIEHSRVYCDPVKLREIFANILSNAYKYTNAGGHVSMVLKERPCEREGWALYETTITDDGIGIGAEFLPHIFEEITREKTTTDAKIEGTGLGMPIVKKLVEMLDGTIEVTSTKGVGTQVVVRIPHRIAGEEAEAELQGRAVEAVTFSGKRILLAEDNELNAEIALEILGQVGFKVEWVEDGAACVLRLQEASDYYYDLILMDIQMPRMNGYEAARKIRALDNPIAAEIPIVAMTANAFEEDKRAAMKAGMNGHVAKPIDIDTLMKTLSTILAEEEERQA